MQKNNSYKNLPHPQDVAMIDFEASSLRGAKGISHEPHRTSYPIEVGISFIDGPHESCLIKPQPDWQDWNGEPDNNDIGKIHGISRRELFEKGQDPKDIAQWLNDRLNGVTVMCDSPDAKIDKFWLTRLYDAAETKPTFELHFLYDYIDIHDPDMGKAYDNTGLSREAPHRALEDAYDIMILYNEYYNLKNDNNHTNNPEAPSL